MSYFRSIDLPTTNLNARVMNSVNSVTSGPYLESYIIMVETNSIALYVWLEAVGIQGRFSDNGFTLTTPTKEVIFLSKQFISVEMLQNSLSVRSYNKNNKT